MACIARGHGDLHGLRREDSRDTLSALIREAHNHTNGEPRSSRADEAPAQTLKAARALVDVRLLDHFIVTSSQAVPMAEMGLL